MRTSPSVRCRGSSVSSLDITRRSFQQLRPWSRQITIPVSRFSDKVPPVSGCAYLTVYRQFQLPDLPLSFDTRPRRLRLHLFDI
eukprot:6204614-Pleurochrysis_carterae.AAC.3